MAGPVKHSIPSYSSDQDLSGATQRTAGQIYGLGAIRIILQSRSVCGVVSRRNLTTPFGEKRILKLES